MLILVSTVSTVITVDTCLHIYFQNTLKTLHIKLMSAFINVNYNPPNAVQGLTV